MGDREKGAITRRRLLKAGTAMAAMPIFGISAPNVLAQGMSKSPTKVLDFMTNADVAKAEQEGQLVFYCHENEAGTAGIMEGFRKDFPKIKTSYVRAQTGALYNKILSERSAGRFDVDVIQLSDLAPAFDFQKKGGYEHYVSPETSAYKDDNLSAPHGYFFWTGVDPAGIAYNTDKITAADAPKNWKDLLNPAWKGKISCKISASGLQFVQWYCLRKLYGADFWKEFAKLQPHAFDSRVQLFDRLAKGDDMLTAIGEYPAYILFKSKGAKVTFVAPPDGLVATPLVVGAVSKAPHPEAANCSSTGRCRSAARPGTRPTRTSITARCAPTPRRCRPALSSATSSCSTPRIGTSTPKSVTPSPKNGTACSACDVTDSRPQTRGRAVSAQKLAGYGARGDRRGAGPLPGLLPFQAAFDVGDPQVRPPTAYGFGNFDSLFQYPQILLNTLTVSLAAAAMALVIGFLMAWILARTNVPGRKVFEQLMTVPYYLTPLLGALAWSMLGSPESGFINQVWRALGGQRAYHRH